MWKTILDLLMPINCLGCGREGQFICPTCLGKIPLNQKSPFRFNQVRFNQGQPMTGLIVTSHYEYPLIKEAIHRYKYDLVKDLAGPLGRLMAKQLSACLKISEEDTFLLAVPLHPKRLRWRGFNQAELLAQVISQQSGIPLAENILRRSKYRLPQMAIKSSQQRKENIKEAFQLGSPSIPQIKNKTIILVDDVSTTGATLAECARILKPLHPKEIWGLVIAHG
jgi:competence protein ComFC